MVLLVVAALLLVRFVHLSADFPNHSFWAHDHAKFSDEGWYANAGMNAILMGHWYVPGDWAPAVVVPVWPALMDAMFHVTGVSLVAARATEVVFSALVLLMSWALFRRYNSHIATLAFMLLVAGSATAYVFSREALLERPLEALALACILLSSTLRREDLIQAAGLGVLITGLVLTKTTGVFLLPAVLAPIVYRYREDWRTTVRLGGMALGVAMLLLATEQVLFARNYLPDAQAFFAQSQLHFALLPALRKGLRFFYRGTWVDPVLWPVACIGLICSLWWRKLWQNMLWGVCALWILGYGAFIVLHFDGPPRYFSVLVVPVTMMAVMFVAYLWTNHRQLAFAGLWCCGVSLGWNLVSTARMVSTPRYSLLQASEAVRQIEASCEQCNPLFIGHGANEISLHNGIPSLDDRFGTATLAEKIAWYRPGWVLVWNDESLTPFDGALPGRRLVLRGKFPALDDPNRNILMLYQIVEKQF